jgi:phosphatidylglycerophosphatase A
VNSNCLRKKPEVPAVAGKTFIARADWGTMDSQPASRPRVTAGNDPWRDPAVVAASCLWLGRIPFAPGTWGAAAGVPLAIGLAQAAESLAVTAGVSAWPVELGLVAVVNLVGVAICDRAVRRLGRGGDPGCVNLDEAASLPLALAVVPAGTRGPLVLAVAFLLHRALDISKPFPCRRLERLPGGLGVMADDWGAAAWTAAGLAAGRAAGWW